MKLDNKVAVIPITRDAGNFERLLKDTYGTASVKERKAKTAE